MSNLAATQPRVVSTDEPIYSINGWLVFAGICFIYLFFNWYLQTSVLTDDIYYNSLAGRISTDKLAAFVAGQHRYRFLSYLLVPVALVLKMALVAFCIFAGILLTSRTLTYKSIFKIVVFAESAGAACTLMKLLVLAFSKDITNLAQLEGFAPLSLFSLLKLFGMHIPLWLAPSLQTLDLFLVGYILLLAAGLRFLLKESFPAMVRLVLGSYGLALVCYLVGMAFLMISLA